MTVTAPTQFDPVVRRYLLSVALGRVGTGFTLPFTLILLHEVRGIALPTVGLLLALPGVVGLASVPLSGALIDRFGPRPVLRASLLLQAVATAALSVAGSPATALLALLVQGIGLGPSFPAGNALLSGLLSRPEQAARAFGMQFTLINAGIGLGGLVGAAVADVHQAGTFTGLFIASSVAMLAQFVLLPASPRPFHDAEAAAPSYREVWADRVYRLVLVSTLLTAMTGYAALDAGFPAFTRVVGHVSPRTIALSFTVNTALIVALQLPVVRLMHGWRRTRSLVIAALIWAVAWTLLGVSQAVWSVLLFSALFGLGEVFQSPALQPLVNALAPDRLRGRYNALFGSTFSIAFIASPALSGFLIGNGLGSWWIGGLVVGSLVSALVTLRVRALLRDEQDGLLA
jgi:MFS family permease